MTAASRGWIFCDFTLDLFSGRLLRGGEEIPLRPKSFAVLEYLVANAGRLVSREELLTAVWSDAIVTDDSLSHCIADIRRALGDVGSEVVRTMPRRGYVFSPPVLGAAESRSDTPGAAPPGKGEAPTVPAAARSWAGRTSRQIFAGFALLVLIAIVWWASWYASVPDAPAVAQAPPNSIAVLRFADMSENQDQAHLADGLANEILHLLAQAPELLVIARTSSFALEGEDIATVATKLNVAYVLEGSVRRSGDRVRVTTQLVDAATSSHRWSKTYERDLEEIFDVETEIAGAVAKALDVTLADNSEPTSALPRDARAYELFLRGHFFYNRRAPGDIARARELYEQALALDPEFARAWAGLAAIYNLQRWSQWTPQAGIEPEVDADDARHGDLAGRHRQAVEQALRLAPAQPEVHARAAVYHTLSGDLAKRIQHLERARALDPDHPLVLGLMSSHALWGNRLDEAIAVLQRAVLRDPLGASTRSNLADRLLRAHRLEEAMAEYHKVLALGRALSGGEGRVDKAVLGIARVLLLQRKPNEAIEWVEPWPAGEDRDYALAMVYHALGQPLDADAALERLIMSAGTSAPLRIAEVHAYRGDFDGALAWLQRVAGHEDCRRTEILLAFHSAFLARMGGDTRWEAWRADTALAMQECDYRFSWPK